MKNEVLERQVEELKKKVAELEQKWSIGQHLDEQVQTLLCPKMVSYHGPNTVDHLTNFSLDVVMAELRANAPDVVQLLSHLARCERFEEGNGDGDSDQGHLATLQPCASC